MATTTVEEMAASFQEMETPFIVGHPGGESQNPFTRAQRRPPLNDQPEQKKREKFGL